MTETPHMSVFLLRNGAFLRRICIEIVDLQMASLASYCGLGEQAHRCDIRSFGHSNSASYFTLKNWSSCCAETFLHFLISCGAHIFAHLIWSTRLADLSSFDFDNVYGIRSLEDVQMNIQILKSCATILFLVRKFLQFPLQMCHRSQVPVDNFTLLRCCIWKSCYCYFLMNLALRVAGGSLFKSHDREEWWWIGSVLYYQISSKHAFKELPQISRCSFFWWNSYGFFNKVIDNKTWGSC